MYPYKQVKHTVISQVYLFSDTFDILTRVSLVYTTERFVMYFGYV